MPTLDSLRPARPSFLADGRDAPELGARLLELEIREAAGEPAHLEVLFSNWAGGDYADNQSLALGGALAVQIGGLRVFEGRIGGQTGRFTAQRLPEILAVASGVGTVAAVGASRLEFGGELTEVAVTIESSPQASGRRGAGGRVAGPRAIARGVTTASALRVGEVVALARLGPSFAGDYRVTELRRRFDGSLGLRCEFVAERLG